MHVGAGIRERFRAVTRFESVDAVPNFELNAWVQTYERWQSEGLSTADVPSREFQWGCPFFGIDWRDRCDVKLSLLPPFEETVIEESPDYRVYRDSSGRVRKALKRGESQGYRLSMDEYISFPVQTRVDFRELQKRLDPHAPERLSPDYRQKVDAWRNRTHILTVGDNFGFYWNLREWMGTMNASSVFFDDPLLAHEMMEFSADFLIELLHPVLHEVELDYFSFAEDMAYKAGPLISPKIFREFLLQPYQRATDFLRCHGVSSIWMDTDGNWEIMLPLFLEAGINCLWPLEQQAGMDPVHLRKEYGRDLVLSGGIDKRELAKGKREIETELRAKLPCLLEQGGYFPTLDHSVPPNVPLDNYRYYIELKQKMLKGEY